MPEIVYNVKFRIKQEQIGSSGVADITRYEKEIDKLRNTIQKQKEEFEASGNAAKKASKDTATFVNAQNQLSGGAKRMNSSFSSTNQLLFSFSDGIQDASQFSYGFATGMRAVGNNIGFTAELFGSLSAKVKEYNTANASAIASGQMMGKTIKSELIGSLKGPGGALVALNLVITGITMYSRAQEVARKKTEEAKGSIDEYAKALRQLAEIAEPTKTTREGTEADIRNLTIAIELAKQLEKAQKDLKDTSSELALEKRRETFSTIGANVSQEDSQEQLVKSRVETERLIDSLKDQIAQYTDLGTSLTKMQGALANAEKLMKIFRGEVSATTQIELGALVDSMRGDVNRALMAFEVGVGDGRVAVMEQMTTLDMLIQKYKEEATTSDSILIPTLKELLSLREKIAKALGIKTDGSDLGNRDLEERYKLRLEIQEDRRKREQKAQRELSILSAQSTEDELLRAKLVKDARISILNERIKEELLTESEAKLELTKIEQEYDNEIKAIRKDQQDKDKRERELILGFQTRQVAKGRDTEAAINEFYDRKLIQETQRLQDEQITNQEVFNQLSLAIEAERLNEINKLQKDQAQKTIDNEEWKKNMLMQINTDLITSTMGLLTAAFNKNKGLAIAETLVSTYFSAQKAYQSVLASPQAIALGVAAEPLARRAAISAIIQGLARVAAIKSTSIGSGESSRGSGGQSASVTSRTLYGFSTQKQEQSESTPSYLLRSPRMSQPPVNIQLTQKVDEAGFGIFMKRSESALGAKTFKLESA